MTEPSQEVASAEPESIHKLDEVPRYYVSLKGDKNLNEEGQSKQQVILENVVLYTTREIVRYAFGTNFQFIKSPFKIYDANITGSIIETPCGVLVSKCIVNIGVCSLIIQEEFLTFILDYIDNAAYYDTIEQCYVLSQQSLYLMQNITHQRNFSGAECWPINQNVVGKLLRVAFFIRIWRLSDFIERLIEKYGVEYHIGFLCWQLSSWQICQTLGLQDYSSVLDANLYNRETYKKLIDKDIIQKCIDADRAPHWASKVENIRKASQYKPAEIKTFELDTFTAASIGFMKRFQKHCDENITTQQYNELKKFIYETRLRIDTGFVFATNLSQRDQSETNPKKEIIEYPCLLYCYLPFEQWKLKISDLNNSKHLHMIWPNVNLLEKVAYYPFSKYSLCVDFKEKFRYLVDSGLMDKIKYHTYLPGLVIQNYLALGKNIAYELLYRDMTHDEEPNIDLIYFLTLEERQKLLRQLPRESLRLLQDHLLDTEKRLLNPHIKIKLEKIPLFDPCEPTQTNYCIQLLKEYSIVKIEQASQLLSVLFSPNLSFSQMLILSLSGNRFIHTSLIWDMFFRKNRNDHLPIKKRINLATGYELSTDDAESDSNNSDDDEVSNKNPDDQLKNRPVWIEYKNSLKHLIKFIILEILREMYQYRLDWSSYLDDANFEALEIQTEQLPLNLNAQQRSNWILGFYKPLVEEVYDKCQPIPNESEYVARLMEGFQKFTSYSFNRETFDDIRWPTYNDMISQIIKKGCSIDPITPEKEYALIYIAHYLTRTQSVEKFVSFVKENYFGLWQIYEKKIAENIRASQLLGRCEYIYFISDSIEAKVEPIKECSYEQHQLHRCMLKIQNAVDEVNCRQIATGQNDYENLKDRRDLEDQNDLDNNNLGNNPRYNVTDTLEEYDEDYLEKLADDFEKGLRPVPGNSRPIPVNSSETPEPTEKNEAEEVKRDSRVNEKPYDFTKKIIKVKNDHGAIVSYCNGLAICPPIVDISEVVTKEEFDDIFGDATIITNLATADVSINLP